MSLLSVGNPSPGREKKGPSGLNLRERILLHQVHPAKLATDWGTGLTAAWLFWDHRLPAALIVGFLPSILISIYLVLRVDLTRYRDSPLGRYFLSPRTRPGDPVRLFGLLVMWAGAWFNSILAAAAGLAVIVAAWGRGLFAKKREGTAPRRPSR
jgi:hypothetical protein